MKTRIGARTLLLLISFVLAEIDLGAQCPTTNSPPAYQRAWGGEIRDVCALTQGSTQYVWLAEEGGRLARSTDGGVSFTYGRVPSNVRNALLDVFFLDPSNGWAAGKDGVVLNTIDGGVNWSWADPSQQPVVRTNCTANDPPELAKLWAVYFKDTQNGWLAGEGVLRRTTNGGASWSPVTLRSGSGPIFVYENEGCWEFYALDFVQRGSALIGLTPVEKHAAHAGVAFRTTDGLTWDLQDLFSPAPSDFTDSSGQVSHFEAWKVEFVDAPAPNQPTAYLSGGPDGGFGQIYASYDDGVSWFEELRDPTSPYSACSSVSGLSACSNDVSNGCVAPIQNYTHWHAPLPNKPNVMSALYGFAVLGSNSALAVGYAGERYVRDPGTASWVEKTDRCEFTGPLTCCASSGSMIFVGGTWGYLARSLDGGNCYQDLRDAAGNPDLDQSANFRLFDLAFTSASTGWMACSSGVILKTTDGGCHFFEQQNTICTSTQPLQSIAAGLYLGAPIAVAVGGPGIVWRLVNGGGAQETWSSGILPGGAPTLKSASFAPNTNSQTFWAAGNAAASGSVFKTNDAGASWSAITWNASHSLPTSVNVRAIQMLSRAEGFLVGEQSGHGVAYRIRNGTTTTPWADDVTPTGGIVPLNALTARGADTASSEAWTAGDSATLYRFDVTQGTNGRFVVVTVTPPAGVSLANRNFQSVELMTGASDLYLGSDHGLILTSPTPTVASSWTAPDSQTSKTIAAFQFLSATQGWILGQTSPSDDRQSDQADGVLMVYE